MRAERVRVLNVAERGIEGRAEKAHGGADDPARHESDGGCGADVQDFVSDIIDEAEPLFVLPCAGAQLYLRYLI